MASTVRYRADWTSMDGFQYRIDIIDSDFVGTASELFIGFDSFDGFTLDYSGQNTGRFNNILAAECVINCEVTDAAFETLIDDIVNAQEQRFYVAIYKYETSVYNLFWVGLVKQELIQIEDMAKPYLFQLHATDGLGRLKNIDYPASMGTNQTFIEYLVTALDETGITDFWATDDNFLVTAVDWYEGSMFTTSPAYTLDPLNVSRVLNNTFIEDDNGELKYSSCFDVLTQIAQLWGATLVQTNGSFYFIQLNNLDQSTIETRYYKKAGTYITSNSAESFRTSDIIRQGSWNYLPSLREASVTYKYKQSVYYQNLLPDQSNYETAVSFGTVQGGNTEKLVFYGTVRCFMELATIGTWDILHYWNFEMRIQVGTYYLTNEDGDPEWTTNSAKRYIINSPFWHITDNYSRVFNIGFETPSIPTSGEGTFEFDFIEFRDAADDSAVTPPSGYSSEYACLGFHIRQNINNEVESGEQDHVAVNETASSIPVESTTKLNFKPLLMGDGFHDYSDGRVQIYTTGSVWENSNEDWSVGGSAGTGVNINLLLCIEAVAGQKKPKKIYSGDIGSDNIVVLPVNVLSIDGTYYIFRSGTFDANQNIWSGDWVEISVNRLYIDGTSDNNGGDIKIDAIGSGSGREDLQNEIKRQSNNVLVKSNRTLITANHTIAEGENILYVSPTAAGLEVKLPPYDTTASQVFKIINASATYSITVTRDDSAAKINGSASNYTLAADNSIEIHNTAIAAIGWATIFKSSRK